MIIVTFASTSEHPATEHIIVWIKTFDVLLCSVQSLADQIFLMLRQTLGLQLMSINLFDHFFPLIDYVFGF